MSLGTETVMAYNISERADELECEYIKDHPDFYGNTPEEIEKMRSTWLEQARAELAR